MRWAENGSSSLPAVIAVTAMPKIIISQTMVAAGPRRAGATRLASRVSSAVPAAPTPRPTSVNASSANANPAQSCVAISAVAPAAPVPPSASAAMPPTIHGVRRPPRSEP